MTLDADSQEFYRRLCPHRGIGEENTLASIAAAVAAKPFMAEFDVKLYKGRLHIGHPPHIRTDAVLADALDLFASSPTLPKVDIKLNKQDYVESIQCLATALSRWTPKKVLVNVGGYPGDLTAVQYMEAEKLLVKLTGGNVLLNIDHERYAGLSDETISRHVQTLARTPFSISLNLDAPDVTEFALEHGIGHIHFWAHHNRSYEISELQETMRSIRRKGLQVYFDIQERNIVVDASTIAQKFIYDTASWR